MNYSAPSCIDLQRHPLIFSCIRTHSLTMLSPSGEQDQTPNHQSENEACKQRAWDNASIQVGKDILMATQTMTTTKPDSWLWQLLIVEIGCWRCQFHLAACDWMTRLSEGQLASGWAARSESPMNVSVARLLTQWAAMHSLANTALDALLAIIQWTTWYTVHWPVLTFQAIKEPKGLLKSDNKRPDGYILTHSLARRQEINMGRFNHQYGGSIVPSTFVHSRRWSSRDGIGKEDGKICRIVHNILLLSDNHGNFRSFQRSRDWLSWLNWVAVWLSALGMHERPNIFYSASRWLSRGSIQSCTVAALLLHLESSRSKCCLGFHLLYNF